MLQFVLMYCDCASLCRGRKRRRIHALNNDFACGQAGINSQYENTCARGGIGHVDYNTNVHIADTSSYTTFDKRSKPLEMCKKAFVVLL